MISPFALGCAAIAAVLPSAAAVGIDVSSTASIRDASATLAFGLMSYYNNNQSDTPAVDVGTLPPPLYWWEGGALWGGMVDYWAYTQDPSYISTVTEGLLAQVGPDFNYMPPAYHSSLGNDDQAFWGMACLSALEYGFPVPEGQAATLWYDLSRAVFDTQIPRWDMGICNGGLRWQIYSDNKGWDYKNSISNGGFINMAGRLYRYTGEQKYADWAETAWQWMYGIGLIDNHYNVYDGTDPKINCTEINHTRWSYNPAILIYGTAMMYNATGSQVWLDRTTGLLTQTANLFFSPFPNSTNIMYERRCEPKDECNYDQVSFKAYLSRWLAKSAIVAPFIADSIWPLLSRSAEAAAQACSGGESGIICGTRWYTGGFDNQYGAGQSLSALETVQSLLLLRGDVPGMRRFPATQSGVAYVQARQPTGTFTIDPDGTTMPGTGRDSGQSRGSSSRAGETDANAGHRLRVDSSSSGAVAGFWFTLVFPMAVAVVAFGGWLVR